MPDRGADRIDVRRGYAALKQCCFALGGGLVEQKQGEDVRVVGTLQYARDMGRQLSPEPLLPVVAAEVVVDRRLGRGGAIQEQLLIGALADGLGDIGALDTRFDDEVIDAVDPQAHQPPRTRLEVWPRRVERLPREDVVDEDRQELRYAVGKQRPSLRP